LCSLEYSESLESSRPSLTDLIIEECMNTVKNVHVRKVKTRTAKAAKVVDHH